MGLFNHFPLYIVRAVTLVISLSVHEFSHAAAAYALGDETAKRCGRLTLNPLAHLDPFGALMVMLVGFGWAKPVPVSAHVVNRKTPFGLAIVSFAGPASNFLLALIAALICRIPALSIGWFEYALVNFVLINLSLGVFNLLPIAPLDGEKIVERFIPRSARSNWYLVQSYGPQILLAALLILPYFHIDIVGWILSPIVSGLFRLFMGG